jgi:nucleoside-diphosphate-sugar epimerase
MRIFLTGGTGFIGRRLLRLLSESANEALVLARPQLGVHPDRINSRHIRWITGQLDDVATYRCALRRFQPEVCIHLAWYTCPDDYLIAEEANLHQLEVSLKLLRTLKELGCRRFVGSGTCIEYALTSASKLDEKSPTRPSTMYAAAKLAFYHLSEQICSSSQISFAWGRVFHVYGPGENPNRLVPAAIRRLLNGQDFPASAGDQVRDYLYVDDVASAFLRLGETKEVGAFNICSSSPITIRDLLSRVHEMCNSRGRVLFGAKEYNAHDPAFICGSNKRILDLGWQPQTDLESGLNLSISSMQGEVNDLSSRYLW